MNFQAEHRLIENHQVYNIHNIYLHTKFKMKMWEFSFFSKCFHYFLHIYSSEWIFWPICLINPTSGITDYKQILCLWLIVLNMNTKIRCSKILEIVFIIISQNNTIFPEGTTSDKKHLLLAKYFFKKIFAD